MQCLCRASFFVSLFIYLLGARDMPKQEDGGYSFSAFVVAPSNPPSFGFSSPSLAVFLDWILATKWVFPRSLMTTCQGAMSPAKGAEIARRAETSSATAPGQCAIHFARAKNGLLFGVLELPLSIILLANKPGEMRVSPEFRHRYKNVGPASDFLFENVSYTFHPFPRVSLLEMSVIYPLLLPQFLTCSHPSILIHLRGMYRKQTKKEGA